MNPENRLIAQTTVRFRRVDLERMKQIGDELRARGMGFPSKAVIIRHAIKERAAAIAVRAELDDRE